VVLVSTVLLVLGIVSLLFKIGSDSNSKHPAPPTVEVRKVGSVLSENKEMDSVDEPTQFIAFNFYVPEGVKVRSNNKDKNGDFIANGSNPFAYSFVSSMEHTVYVSDAPGRPNEILEFTLDVRRIDNDL
jgi:hypothetical protein